MARNSRSDDIDHALNPHRDEEQQRAADHAADILRGRGIELTGRESAEELADLQAAVEAFEAAAAARGADSFVDSPLSSAPQHRSLVVPARERGEGAAAYAERIERAASELGAR
ncbi:MAG TPA: hypothetical protein VF037_05360 [Gemmatimonadales bacterium]